MLTTQNFGKCDSYTGENTVILNDHNQILQSETKEGILSDLQSHRGWEIIKDILMKQYENKKEYILETVQEGDKVYTELGAAKLELGWIKYLINLPNSLIEEEKNIIQQRFDI